MKHYTVEELDRYRNGDMNAIGRINCAKHLKDCPECRSRFEGLREDDKLLAMLRRNFARFDAVINERSVKKADQP